MTSDLIIAEILKALAAEKGLMSERLSARIFSAAWSGWP